MTWTNAQWFIAGMLLVMGAVLVHSVIMERIKRRNERRFLETYSKVLGIIPKPGESADEMRMRIRQTMEHPSCRSWVGDDSR